MAKKISLYVDLNVCQSCQRCKAVQACRLKAIMQLDPGEPPYLDIERCLDCQVCIPSCPHSAIRKIAYRG